MTAPSFYGYDGMGSVRQLTNASGAVTDTYEYDAFGNLLNKTGTTPNEMLYRGEQWDSDLGLYYLRARWYDPQSGRFMSRDPNNPKRMGVNGRPINPDMLHKYLYAGGDPVNLFDPGGRASILETGSLDEIIKLSGPELLRFGGTVACAFGVDAYAISLLNGGNAMDETLGGINLAAGCALAGVPYYYP